MGATRHVCVDKSLLFTFQHIENGEKMYMWNYNTSEIKGEGKVVLKMTSGKELALNNVIYIPSSLKIKNGGSA